MYYLRIDNENFWFIVDDVNEIMKTDIPITVEEYDMYFNLESQGKKFKLKETVGTSLFECIEEYIQPVDTSTHAPTLEERQSALEDVVMQMLMEGYNV